MKKKLDTRFPAARIKKIMQTDEDVGKMAMAVPLLVSKALELFLQDLCDRTYEITLKRGAKTLSSSHLKQCVQSFNVFDFLREIVRGVPDLGGFTAGGDDQLVAKRRKLADDEGDGGGEDSGRGKMHAVGRTNVGGKGRGRGRGRGCGRRSQANVHKFEGDPGLQDEMQDLQLKRHDEAAEVMESKGDASVGKDTKAVVRSFDLNLGLDDDGNTASTSALGPDTDSTSIKSVPEMTQDEYPEWSLGEMENMVVDPTQLTILNRPIEEEDYDEE